MKITIPQQAVCGSVVISPGEYWVVLESESSTIKLVGKGKDLKLPAVRRRMAVKNRTTTVQFYSGGGPRWSLVICAPKFGEWMSLIEYKDAE